MPRDLVVRPGEDPTGVRGSEADGLGGVEKRKILERPLDEREVARGVRVGRDDVRRAALDERPAVSPGGPPVFPRERHEIDLMSVFRDSDADADMEIVNGDILYIPREPHFYIYGEVQRPGSFRLEKNMTVVQALSVGGGLSLRGTQKGMKILRRSAQGQMEEIAAQLSDMLRPDDVVYVKESLF